MFEWFDQWIFSFQEDRGTLVLFLMGFTGLLSFRLLWSGFKQTQLSYKMILISLAFLMSINIYLMTLPKLGIMPVCLTISFMFAAASLFLKKYLRLFFQSGAFLGIALFCISLFTGISLNISYGPSMWPTSGRHYNWIFTDTNASFKQGDTVQLHIPPQRINRDIEQWRPGSYHKRVLAMPGDTILIFNDYIQVNQDIVMDCRSQKIQLTGHRWLCPTQFQNGNIKSWMVWGDPDYWMLGQGLTLKLGADEVFLMGDNAPESGDSRDEGPAHTSWILGNVLRLESQETIEERIKEEQL